MHEARQELRLDAATRVNRGFAQFMFAALATFFVLVVVWGYAGQVFAAERVNTNSSAFAIGGYDPVGHFREQKPVVGSDAHTATWNGKTWRFATAENRAAFLAEPDRYAPRYGGFCAYAVSQGYVAPIDPAAFSIVDGRLYLNYSPAIKQRWEKDCAAYVGAAEKNWPKLSQE
ncbi:MAG: YHS domain protein [Alphaproteobacteria bacterium]|nr:YHS domain protein [Alphaproteobacteria bacterium]